MKNVSSRYTRNIESLRYFPSLKGGFVKKILESEARQRIRSKIAKLEKSLKNNTKPTKYRITIEHPAQDPMVFEYDHANWSCEKSLEVIQYPDGHADMKLSGQERMSIDVIYRGSLC